ncbi:hypothetical protein J6590_102234 [Homalodisca vitripennis]|nr:hypothetical protein J6590_102234 [Homalodisca vitripennis]
MRSQASREKHTRSAKRRPALSENDVRRCPGPARLRVLVLGTVSGHAFDVRVEIPSAETAQNWEAPDNYAVRSSSDGWCRGPPPPKGGPGSCAEGRERLDPSVESSHDSAYPLRTNAYTRTVPSGLAERLEVSARWDRGSRLGRSVSPWMPGEKDVFLCSSVLYLFNSRWCVCAYFRVDLQLQDPSVVCLGGSGFCSVVLCYLGEF